MMNSLLILAGGGAPKEPIFTNPVIEGFKDLINALSVPEISLTFFFLPLFILMMWLYRWWTKPIIAIGLLGIFCFAYFGSMLIDYNYLLILAKPDNVPITLMLLTTGFCLWVAFRQAALNDEALEAGKPLPFSDREDKVLVWPDLVYTEMICLILATAFLVVWAIVFRAPLEAPANPAGPPNPSKAPWYFLGLQEMLVYYDPWMAGVLLPGMIVTGLIGMPYMDTNPKGNGYYTVKQRPFALTTWLFGFIVLWVVLIVYGTFLRGPNWNFYGPYQYWDAHIQVPLTNVNLSEYMWNWWLGKASPANPIQREILGIVLTAGWVFGLPAIMMWSPAFVRKIPIVGAPLQYFRRMYLQMGFFRFAFMAIHFVVMAMLPLKMGLRWLFNLKYFIYLPEFNLNL